MARVELNTPAPPFTLEDFRGEEVALSSLLEERHVVLVFNRGFT
jgi:peroxiredoxin